MLFIVSGCQINQSMSILKEKLFSETDEEEKEDNEISKSLDIKNEVKESSIVENLEHKNKEVQKDEMSSELKDNKIKKEATLEKKESKETKVLRFKEMAQTRETESKIVSFFTKFFVDDAEGSGDKESFNSSTIKKIESKADKNKEKNLSQNNKDSSRGDINTESVDSDSFSKAYISKDFIDPEGSAEGIEDQSYTDNRDYEEVSE